MATIWVKAKVPGTKCPREDDSRRYIGDEPTEVERSLYYTRRLMHEDLEQLDEAASKAATAAKAEAAKKTTKGKE